MNQAVWSNNFQDRLDTSVVPTARGGEGEGRGVTWPGGGDLAKISYESVPQFAVSPKGFQTYSRVESLSNAIEGYDTEILPPEEEFN